jgi:hypothetical protein
MYRPPLLWPIRQAQAQVFAADIRQRAAALIGADNEVAGNLTATAGDVGDRAVIA